VVDERDAEPGEDDGGEAKARPLHGEEVKALLQEEVGEGKEGFDEPRVLVVDPPVGVHRARLDGLVNVLQEERKPASIGRGGLKIKTLVARIAEIGRAPEEQDHVAERQAHGRGGVGESVREGASPRAHRVSASKQKCLSR
jgi:hypothetical protein